MHVFQLRNGVLARNTSLPVSVRHSDPHEIENVSTCSRRFHTNVGVSCNFMFMSYSERRVTGAYCRSMLSIERPRNYDLVATRKLLIYTKQQQAFGIRLCRKRNQNISKQALLGPYACRNGQDRPSYMYNNSLPCKEIGFQCLTDTPSMPT